MKKSLTIFAILMCLTCFGQSELILSDNGETLENIIPNNWKLLDSTSGDLNQDGVSDLVFAIQKTDRNNIELNDGLGTDTIDLNPRILAIYFGNISGGFNINKKGILDINYRFWYSAGSWSMFIAKIGFR